MPQYALSPEEHVLEVGAWVQFQLRRSEDGATWEDAEASYWITDDRAVATIDQSGAAVGVSAGTANVTAVIDATMGEVAFAVLTVSAPPMTYVAVSPSEHSMPVGAWVQFQLRSTVEGSGEWQDASPAYWTVDDASVATIDETGAAVGVAAGTTNVAAVVDASTNQVAWAQLTVTDAEWTRA